MTDAPPPAAPPVPRWPAVAAAAVFFVVALARALGPPDGYPRDLFIYRLGAELALRGENPYDIPKVRGHVAAEFPPDDAHKALTNTHLLVEGDLAEWVVRLWTDTAAKSFPLNCGYFLPPMGVVLYLPFALLPWKAAMVAWAVANGTAGYAVARVVTALRVPGAPVPVFLATVGPFLLLLNPLTPFIAFPVGQTSVVCLGCVVAGLLARDRGRPYLMAALWAVPFVKPHLALSLVPLCYFLSGWRPAALLIVLVAALNALGATIVGGSPAFLKEYLDFLPQVRDAVRYNRVELNAGLSSWNRLLYGFGGPLIELGLGTTLAGYLVWYGLLVGRWAATGVRPSAAWAAAATGAGAALCCQVLVYELMVLVVAVPWLRDLFAGGYRTWGVAGGALLGAHLVSLVFMQGIGLAGHHPLAVALFALAVLTGPADPLRPATR
ncbi:glycosyltransferase family 87 protein [Gemmata sp.]|uniref:glycosyltransferase family 87 protein n=1 Tax=Gemmata sp. TaxID=1914242 RepID=UPI003F70A33D